MENQIQSVPTGCPVPNGILMIIGGAEKKNDNAVNTSTTNMEVLTAFLNLIDQKNPVIELVTTAGEEDIKETFETYKKAFSEICECRINQIHHQSREEINEEELSGRLQVANAVFFTGGDQLKLTSIYGGTNFLYQLKESYIHHGMLIGGTSAGAMALATPMIFAGTGAEEMIAGNVKITTGFEFLRDICIDTHFVHRGRFVRMAQVIATNPACTGIGVEEDTAIVVKNGKEATVVGCGVVITIDGKESKGNNITHFNGEKTLSIRELKVSILSDRDQFEIPQLNPPHE